MTKDEIVQWALRNGWQMLDGNPCLTKPRSPHPATASQAIVRLILKATVANLEIKKPAGKWEKVASESYARIVADPDQGTPSGLKLDTLAGLNQLMQDNQDRQTMARMGSAKP
jgi:hypothetical protein